MADTPTIPPKAEGLLTRERVAERLALSVPTIDRLIARRDGLRAVRIGRAVRVREADLQRFIDRLAEVR